MKPCPKQRISQKELGAIAGVTENTVRSTVRELREMLDETK